MKIERRIDWGRYTFFFILGHSGFKTSKLFFSGRYREFYYDDNSLYAISIFGLCIGLTIAHI